MLFVFNVSLPLYNVVPQGRGFLSVLFIAVSPVPRSASGMEHALIHIKGVCECSLIVLGWANLPVL